MTGRFLPLIVPLALAAIVPGGTPGAGEKAKKVAGWATYRGNAQRTGNTDGIAGPAKPAPPALTVKPAPVA